MSYCRFGESDVYLYQQMQRRPTKRPMFVCAGCKLQDTAYFIGYADTIAHLREHVAAGHRVPQEAFERLEAEQAEEKAR